MISSNDEDVTSWLYGFKCGGAAASVEDSNYFMVKIGIVYTNSFSRVLKRFYDEQRAFRSEMNLNIHIPVKYREETEWVPSSGSKFAGAQGELRVTSLDELISALQNPRDNMDSRPSENVNQLLEFDDLMFILPFLPNVDTHEICLFESVCRYAFGGAILSDFKIAAEAHKRQHDPTSTTFAIPFTELVLCPEQIFNDTRSLFIVEAVQTAQALWKAIPSSTFHNLHKNMGNGDTTHVKILCVQTQSWTRYSCV
ncbi:unnamed protein product [Rotaria magnacalcarata]|uniref:Uncharacterized protein n=1 Tax=Rotaria magnacalcarata TaxID=392030 RepID=A0A820MQG7_9BILA|nr:unnamed protein product [Rotaria magnacalcarata]CAF4376210.1 unnamed protein product [Rotaria magnacalcarata]